MKRRITKNTVDMLVQSCRKYFVLIVCIYMYILHENNFIHTFISLYLFATLVAVGTQ